MTTSTTAARSDRAGADLLAADLLPADASPNRALPLLGGAALLVAPLLFAGGSLTSPPQDSGSRADYIRSLADDPTLTAVSADLFHYSWVLFAFGALAAIGLVRGRRGRALTTVGGVLSAFGAIQFTGLLFSDWFLGALGNRVPIDLAVRVFDDVNDPSVTVWLLSAKLFGLLGFPVLYAGLARAGVISWWLVPAAALPFVAMAVLPGAIGVLVGAALQLPAYVVGWRLVQRARLAA